MATVEFTAFVNSKLTSEDGQVWLLKTAESHRRENKETGEWETTARTFRDVRLSKDADPDMFASFNDGDRVLVKGFELTIHTQRGDQDFYNLNVYADSAELVESDAVATKSTQRTSNRR